LAGPQRVSKRAVQRHRQRDFAIAGHERQVGDKFQCRGCGKRVQWKAGQVMRTACLDLSLPKRSDLCRSNQHIATFIIRNIYELEDP
jgi:hypothetical protein